MKSDPRGAEADKAQSEIDAALRLLGGAQPPPGLEKRINVHLRIPRRRLRPIYFISGAGLAASIGFSILALTPVLRQLSIGSSAVSSPQVLAAPAPVPQRPSSSHSTSSFGAASALRVPVVPIPIKPVTGHGRGHSRYSRTVQQTAAGAPRSHQVSAVPAVTDLRTLR